MEAQCAADVSYMIEKINELGDNEPGRRVILLGDGVPVYREQLQKGIRIPYLFASPSNSRQRAASVAALGAVYYAAGRTVTAAAHKPEYLRKSQAEREREEQADEGGNGSD